ncbi:hypothetical protein [Sinorhizobium meliloti]|uniref:hypothetical protein n=1 Tax=Rhizobium meliloti TaxID=382 RepID=UPI002090AAFB|nr:hypothetical protein [Sinorhizobium meliloti]MCO5965067.1 hypothetical protein [Sinorhizobium meliloti]
MLKQLLLALPLLAGGSSVATAATVAVATGNVNLRAGPSTGYPVVTVVPVGGRITNFGCVARPARQHGYRYASLSAMVLKWSKT